MMSENCLEETFEECSARHKREKKDLQAEIQKLKHSVPKGDKKKKKEINDRVSALESELDARHKIELEKISRSDETDLKAHETLNENGISKDMKQMNISADNTNTEQDKNELNEEISGFKFTEVDKKSCKAVRRKEKKAQKNKEQQEIIREQEVKNQTGPRVLEQQKILELLRLRNFSLKEIPSDGDCLYSAICDQLSQRGKQTNVQMLRHQTATHMRSHSDDFQPFLIHESTGELYTTAEFEDYCHRVEATPEWGGHTEIRALSDIHQVPVEVLQAEGSNVLIGEQFNQVAPLVITYHRHAYGLGAHYNSVRPTSVIDTALNAANPTS